MTALLPAELRKVPEQHAQPNPSACLTLNRFQPSPETVGDDLSRADLAALAWVWSHFTI